MTPDERALMHAQERHDEQVGGCEWCGGVGWETWYDLGHYSTESCRHCHGSGVAE